MLISDMPVTGPGPGLLRSRPEHDFIVIDYDNVINTECGYICVKKDRKLSLVTERILLHLLDFKSCEGERDGKMDLTQIGIADAVGIKRGNMNQDMRPLIVGGFVDCHKVHVPGIKIKRNNYYLTPQGHEMARAIRERIVRVRIEVIDRERARSEASIGDLLENTHLDIGLVDVVREANTSGTFDIGAFLRKRARPAFFPPSGIAGMPRPASFFGRMAERALVSNWMKSRAGTTLVIRGMPGIGKTSFVSHFLSESGKGMKVHYFSIRPWCSLRALLVSLSAFFEDNGGNELRRYLEGSKAIDPSEAEYLISGTLAGIRDAVLVFDDCHNSSGDVPAFFEMLHNAAAGSGARLVFVGRDMPQYFDRKETVEGGSVLDITLEGLDRESTLALAGKVGIPDGLAGGVFSRTNGHPLFVELLATGGSPQTDTDVERFINDEVITSLEKRELAVLRYMSVLRYAIGREALGAHHKTLSALIRKSMVRPLGDSHLELHDMMRAALYRGLSPGERKKFHAKAAGHYLESRTIDNIIESLHHLISAERYADACMVILDKEEKLLNSDRMEELARVLALLLAGNLRMGRREKAHILYLQGHALSFIGEWDDAIMHFNRAMVLASPDERLGMMCKSGVAQISLRRHNFSIAKSLFEDIFQWADENDDMDMKAESGYFLGSTFELSGSYDKALKYFTEAKQISYKTYNRNQIAMANYGQGRIHHRRHEYEKALESKNEALEIALKINNKHIASKILTSIGNTLDCLERRDEELQAHENAIKLARECGAIRTLAYALSNTGAAYLDITELDVSERYLDESAIIFEKLGENHMIATIFLNKAIIALYKKNNDMAIHLFQECENLLNALDNKIVLMDSYFRFGLAHKKMKLFNEAILYFKRAISISIKIKDEKSQRQIDLEISQIKN